MTKDIKDFSLAWRWTQESHNVLPPEVLAQLSPLNKDDANKLNQSQHEIFKKSKLRRDKFHSLQEHDTTIPPSGFLSNLQIEDDREIFLSWNAETALKTSWAIFKEYWDDFCYPASDDLSILPEDQSWVLFYWHEELFQFGRQKNK